MWSHAISNSEDVPCTKWPPARRSEGVEKRCGLSEPKMWRVVEGPREARFFFTVFEGEVRAFVDRAPHNTRDDSSGTGVAVGGGWWRVWSVFRPRAG